MPITKIPPNAICSKMPISSCTHIRQVCQYTYATWIQCSKQSHHKHWYTYISHYWYIPSHLICPLTCESLRHQWQCDKFLPSHLIHGCLLGPAKGQVYPFLDVILPPLLLLAPPSFPGTMQDGFGKAGWVADMTIPLQHMFLNSYQKVLKGANGCFDSAVQFFIGIMIFAWVVQDLVEASHLHGLGPSLLVYP